MNKPDTSKEIFQQIMKTAFETKLPVSEHPLDDEDLLLRWTGHQLTPIEHDNLLAHLARCSDCRKGVAEMIKAGILDFGNDSTITPSLPRTLFHFPKMYQNWALGGIVTTALCLLLGFFLLKENPDTSNVAMNRGANASNVTNTNNTPGETGGEVKFRGTPELNSETEQYAMLVGINKYGKLKESEWLEGCHNDIEVIKEVLTDRFGFSEKNITILLDEQATAAGIREQWHSLVKRIRQRSKEETPAQVLFYFSGHGSRVPDQPEGDPDCDSEDGFDSTLVVYDSEQQGSGSDIRDDELNKFAHEICNEGKAELLVALDSCHSGGGIRGVAKFRGIDRPIASQESVAGKNRKFTPKTIPEGTVFLSACLSHQKEPEETFDGKKHGLFTHHFARILQKEQLLSSLNYASLKDLIHQSYLRGKIVHPTTPTVEGSQKYLRKPILGANRSVDRTPYWKVEIAEKDRSALRMEAGKINDITTNSLFELYETAEQAIDPDAKSIGWLRIVKVEGNYSSGTFFKWKDENRSEQLDVALPNSFKSGVAVERYHDYGDNILSVRLINTLTGATISPGDKTIPGSISDVLLGNFGKNESAWIQWVDEDQPCDIVLKFDEQAKLATVFPAIGYTDGNREITTTRGTVPEMLRGGWGPIEWGTNKGKAELIDISRRIMRVMCLKRLVAEKGEFAETARGATTPKLAISIHRCDSDGENQQPITIDPEKEIVLEGGEDDYYQISTVNNDSKAMYITILCIDPDMQINAFPFGPKDNPYQFDPDVGTNNNRDANKLDQGEEFVSIFGFEEPYGPHSIIVIATGEPSDFSSLTQAGLEKTKGRNGTTSPIFQFIQDQCEIGVRATTRPPVPRNDSWSIGAIDIISEP